MRIPRVAILPQIGPLSKDEVILSPDHVLGSLASRLASSHFRNQLRLLPESYEVFKALSEESWPGIQIRELEGWSGLPGDPLALMIRDGEFVTEVGNMGHGLQMWLQTMWFVSLAGGSDTVILDEPDVYMHPDLQRRLVRIIRKRYPQVIMTTHSTEIMAEASPDEIVVIDRGKPVSTRATSAPAVQRIVSSLGSIHNLHIARLFNSKRFLLLEGKEVSILKAFQNLLVPETKSPLDAVPRMAIGGWGGWSYAVGSSMFISNAADEKIRVYCILDSDYHTGREISTRMAEAAERGVDLHIWSKKEIENYLIDSAAIVSAITLRKPRRAEAPTVGEASEKIDRIIVGLLDEAFDGLSQSILAEERGLGAGGANKLAREIMQERIKREGGAHGLVSGKRVLSAIFGWSQEEFGVSLNTTTVVESVRVDAVSDEIRNVILAIESGEPLERPYVRAERAGVAIGGATR